MGNHPGLPGPTETPRTATYVARHRRDELPLSPEEEQFLSHVRKNWTEEAGFLKSLGIGAGSGIAAMSPALAARAVRRRESGRRT